MSQIYTITESQTIPAGYVYYVVDIDENITLSIPETTELTIYNLLRKDTSSFDCTISLYDPLFTGENSFKIYPLSNITLVWMEGSWYITAGYSKDR